PVAGGQARAYADYLPDDRIDADARQRLQQLQGELARQLPPGHIYRYQPAWGAWPDAAALDAFCARVEGDLRGVIEAELGRLESLSAVQQEARAHADFGRERSRHFLG